MSQVRFFENRECHQEDKSGASGSQKLPKKLWRYAQSDQSDPRVIQKIIYTAIKTQNLEKLCSV